MGGVDNLGLEITYPELDKNLPILNNKDSILLDFIELNIITKPKSIIYSLSSQLVGFVEDQVDELINTANASSKYFGHDISLNKRVLTLWPILLIDENNEKQLASVSIEFYEHRMAILKISYPIKNQTSYHLTKNNPNSYYKKCYYNESIDKKISIKNFDYKRVQNNSIHSVTDIILNWLDNNSNGFIHSEEQEIIQLNQLKHQNIDVRQAKKKEKEAIYRIVNAPVNDGIKLHPERNMVWDKRHWGNERVRYLFSTMGRCVAISGHNIKDSLPEDTPEEDEDDILKRSLLLNVEDAYKVMLLNRLNSFNFLVNQSKKDYQKLKSLEEDYYLTENYILGLLDSSFGSVRELYSKIEEVTRGYLNKKSLEKRFNNNHHVLNNRHQEIIKKENDRLTILGLLITVLVSFPAIYETLSILQRELVTTDIPWISVLGLSIFFEATLLIFLFYWYIKKK